MPKDWPPLRTSVPPNLPAIEEVSASKPIRIFASTPYYLQGPGAVAHVGEIADRYGQTPGLVIDRIILPLIGDAILRGFDMPPLVEPFSGEVTDAHIAALSTRLAGCDVIIGVGGGKALDAAKAVALRLQAPVISVPTIASNDGAASRGIAIYDDSHRLVRVDQLPANPVAIIVDSGVIAQAPARFLRAGIGDAIAKTFEAQACRRDSGLNKHGTIATHSALAIADAAYRLLRVHAVAAVTAVEQGELTESVEATIEACVLLSALGFENGGLSIAHSVTRGLMALPGAEERLHGEHVAYGLLVQLAAEGQTHAVLDDMAGFLACAGLPTSLAGLDVDSVTSTLLADMADAIMASPHIRGTTRQQIEQAIARVEAFAAR